MSVYGEPAGVGQVEGGSGRTDIIFSLECFRLRNETERRTSDSSRECGRRYSTAPQRRGREHDLGCSEGLE